MQRKYIILIVLKCHILWIFCWTIMNFNFVCFCLWNVFNNNHIQYVAYVIILLIHKNNWNTFHSYWISVLNLKYSLEDFILKNVLYISPIDEFEKSTMFPLRTAISFTPALYLAIPGVRIILNIATLPMIILKSEILF